jgi:hypothetical protein
VYCIKIRGNLSTWQPCWYTCGWRWRTQMAVFANMQTREREKKAVRPKLLLVLYHCGCEALWWYPICGGDFLGPRCTFVLTQLAAYSTSGDRRHPLWFGTRTALHIARTMRSPDSMTWVS